jgi:hypothetical protein
MKSVLINRVRAVYPDAIAVSGRSPVTGKPIWRILQNNSGATLSSWGCDEEFAWEDTIERIEWQFLRCLSE